MDDYTRSHLARWCHAHGDPNDNGLSLFSAMLDFVREHFPNGIGERTWQDIRNLLERE